MIGVDRRTFIVAVASALLARRGTAAAQRPAKVWRIGLLCAVSRQSLVELGRYDAFVQGMRALGYVEGKNFIIEGRFADGNYERLSGYAAELVQIKVDVIVAVPSPAIRAARDATTTIPIVFPSTGDPVSSGFAVSLAHPGKNLTGLTNSNLDISAKTLELLIATVPNVSHVGILANPGSSTESEAVKTVGAAAMKFGVRNLTVEARTPDQIERAFAIMAREHADAVVIAGDAFLNTQVKQIAELAIRFRLPSITQTPRYANAGGLMSYGQDTTDSYRRAAGYVDKILKGANAGDLPIEQPTKFDLIINLKTAKALGLAVPESLLLRADSVIR